MSEILLAAVSTSAIGFLTFGFLLGLMMLMSFLVGLPFSLTAMRFNRLNIVLQSIAGLVSVGLGLFIGYEKAFLEGLFS